jgi:hypothetical protein
MLGSAIEGSENVYPLSGMMMGKFNVEKTADGREVIRGPGLGSSIQPSLRGSGSEVSLEDLREIVKTQAEEAARPKPSPTESAAARGDGLLGSKARNSGPPGLEAMDSDGAEKPREKSGPLRAIYFVIGIGVGIAWFLKSRRKRR